MFKTCRITIWENGHEVAIFNKTARNCWQPQNRSEGPIDTDTLIVRLRNLLIEQSPPTPEERADEVLSGIWSSNADGKRRIIAAIEAAIQADREAR